MILRSWSTTIEGFHGSGTPNNSRSIAHAHTLVLSTHNGFWRVAQQVYVTSPGRTVNPVSCEPLGQDWSVGFDARAKSPGRKRDGGKKWSSRCANFGLPFSREVRMVTFYNILSDFTDQKYDLNSFSFI